MFLSYAEQKHNDSPFEISLVVGAGEVLSTCGASTALTG